MGPGRHVEGDGGRKREQEREGRGGREEEGIEGSDIQCWKSKGYLARGHLS